MPLKIPPYSKAMLLLEEEIEEAIEGAEEEARPNQDRECDIMLSGLEGSYGTAL